MIAKNLFAVLFIGINFVLVLAIEMTKLTAFGSIELLRENVFLVLILNYALLPLVGMVMGKLFALTLNKRWSGYLCILIMILLVCGLFRQVNTGIYLTLGVNLDSIFRFFQFEQPNDGWVTDYLYLVPAEKYRFCLFGMWIAGCESLLCAICPKRKGLRLVLASACGLCCVLFAAGVVNAGNYVNYDLNYGNAANKSTEFENDSGLPMDAGADFSIKKCSMTLNITDELEADAVLALGDETVYDYRFTLYRGYELTSVTDENGIPLEYDREYDYITIHAAKAVSEIHMSYHGYQQSFYSNSQGMMLPGYFAWYPQAGFRHVFDYRIVDSYLYYGFHVQEESLLETEYQIQVSYGKEVFSNLKKDGDVFAGRSSAPTLMAGAAAEEFRDDGHYIFPALVDVSEVSLAEIKTSLADYCTVLGISSEKFDQLCQLIVVPSSVYMGDTWGQDVIVDDCLFVGTSEAAVYDPDELACEVLRQYINVQGDKTLISDVMLSVLQDSLYLQELEPTDEAEFLSVSYDKTDSESEEYMNLIMNYTIDRMYLMLLEKYDESEVLHRTVSWLMDADASENAAEFMQGLYHELEGK